jgi:hypothetical protein
MDKRNFYIKAALIGALGTSIGSYSYNNLGNVSINVPLWMTTLIFIEHFQFVLLFWLAFEDKIQAKYWVPAGFLGSLLFAISFWIMRGFIYPEPSSIYLFDKLFIGGLGAVPIWLELRRHYSKAYLWLVANVVGYAFIGIFPVIWSFILSIRVMQDISGYSFFTGQLIPNGLWVIAYSLFGLLLGVCLDKIIKDGNVEIGK